MRVEGAPGALVVIISGPSGVGKDTIIDAMQGSRTRARTDRRLRDHLHDARAARRTRSTASTTCSGLPRRSRGLREANGLLEYAEVHGNWYGTPRDQVVRCGHGGSRRDPQDRRPGRPGRACAHPRMRC